jgi:tetratricopeptide (TPR) repeat protein
MGARVDKEELLERYEATGDTEGALADWRRALELDPDHIGRSRG